MSFSKWSVERLIIVYQIYTNITKSMTYSKKMLVSHRSKKKLWIE